MTDYTAAIVTAVLIFLVFLVLLYRSIYPVAPYQLGVVTVFGAYKGILRPGFNVASPVSRVILVDLRTQHLVLPPSTFNLPTGNIQVSAEITYRIVDAAKSLFQVADVKVAILEASRKAILEFGGGPIAGAAGPTDFQLAQAVTDRLSHEGERWGITVESVVVQRSG